MDTLIEKKKSRLTGTGYFLSKKMGKAINDYKMIQDGDRIIVGVSGGKDSLTLLTLLHRRRKRIPIDYTIIAVHVQTDYKCKSCIHRETLSKFCEERGYEYYIEEINILKNPDGSQNEIEPHEIIPVAPLSTSLRGDETTPLMYGSILSAPSSPPRRNVGTSRNTSRGRINCFWCSWNKRKALFAMAEKHNCNRIAFGHHRDDITQTMLLNIFYQGEISTMAPKVSLFNGKLDIIRPLAYIEEKDIVIFAKEQGFPSQLCACPIGQRSQRSHMKDIIRDVEKVCPNVKKNIFNSMKKIKKNYLV